MERAWDLPMQRLWPHSNGKCINHVSSSSSVLPARGCGDSRNTIYELEGHIREANSMKGATALGSLKRCLQMMDCVIHANFECRTVYTSSELAGHTSSTHPSKQHHFVPSLQIVSVRPLPASPLTSLLPHQLQAPADTPSPPLPT